MAVIYLACGCFWCSEAGFAKLKGVSSVRPGYMGGHTKNPSYQDVCSGKTQHAECVEVSFDEAQLPLTKLLEVFFTLHDPTMLNRQGNDIGTQYRSEIFYTNQQQRQIAETVMTLLTEQRVFKNPMVTKLTPATTFYKAEQEHIDYYNRNKGQPYCQFVVKPKLEKINKVFASFITAKS